MRSPGVKRDIRSEWDLQEQQTEAPNLHLEFTCLEVRSQKV